MSLYQDVVKAGLKVGNHESDLYVKWTKVSAAMVKASGLLSSTFIDNIDNELWIEIPGAFDPFWEATSRMGRAMRAGERKG